MVVNLEFSAIEYLSLHPLRFKLKGSTSFYNSFLLKVGCADFEREPNRQSLQQINLSSPKFLHSETFGELFSNRAFDWGSAVAILGKFSNEETSAKSECNQHRR